MNKVRPKIHLLMSVYLTNELIQKSDYYGVTSKVSTLKVNQFLSTIHSISKITFDSAEINFDVSSDYAEYVEIISNFIKVTIKPDIINIGRLEFFMDWQNASKRIPENTELVLLKTNHDHVFIQESEEGLQRFIEILSRDQNYFIGEITHWPEAIGSFNSGNWIKTEELSLDSVFISKATKTIGTCLVQSNFFKSWWLSDFTGGSRIVRPDNPFGPGVKFPAVNKYIPAQEFFRHLDGYGHVNVKSLHAAPVRSCCVLIGDAIYHTDWRRKELMSNPMDKGELPLVFDSKNQGAINHIVNHILLASSYRVNFKNILYILILRTHGSILLIVKVLFIVFRNRYFLDKFLNLFLATDYGNFFLFKLKKKFSRKLYFKNQFRI